MNKAFYPVVGRKITLTATGMEKLPWCVNTVSTGILILPCGQPQAGVQTLPHLVYQAVRPEWLIFNI